MRVFRRLFIFLQFVLLLSLPAYAGESSSEKRRITLANTQMGWEHLGAAITLLKTSQRDVGVDVIDMEYDRLSVAIMAGEADPDVMALSYEDYLLYAKRGVLEELSQSTSIMESLKQWVPGAYELLKMEDKLFALPLFNTSWVIVLDGAMYRISGFEWPKEDVSWSELADLAERAGLGRPGKPALIEDWISFPQPLEQYLALQTSENEHIRFDTAIFRDTMEAYKKMVNSGAILDSESGRTASAVAYIYGWDISQVEDAERRQMPTLEGKEAITVLPYVLAVNRNSDHMDLAMNLLECFASPEAQGANTFALVEFMLKDVSGYQRNRLYSEEDFVYRERLFEHWILCRNYPELLRYCWQNEVFLDFYAGKIDMEQLIRGLQNAMDMIQME